MLRILGSVPLTLNPHLAFSAAAELIVESLVAWSPDGKPMTVLAAEVPTVQNGGVSADLLSITWKLKPGVKWSDGTPFTADDVVFTFRYCMQSRSACVTAYRYEGIARVEALDPATVRITWSAPVYNPLQQISPGGGEILQKRQFSTCIGEAAAKTATCQQANNAPIGTGPYKVREFRNGDVVIYDLNEHYRQPNKPFFRSVQIKASDDALAAARAVLQTGDADLATGLLQLERPLLEQLLAGGKGELVIVPGGYTEKLILNRANPDPALGDKRAEPDQPHPFLIDLKVRQALALAIDREAIAAMFPPGSTPTCELITTEPYIARDQIQGARHRCQPDIAGAKRLLEAAGWKLGSDGLREKNGVRLTMLYQTSTMPLQQKIQALVKAAWHDVGVDVELKSTPGTVFFSFDAGNPDTFWHFFADVEAFGDQYGPDPTPWFCSFTSKAIARKSNGWRGTNSARYANPEYDRLCEQIHKESDPDRRTELIRKMNDILVEDVVLIPLVSRPTAVMGRSKRLQGMHPNPWFTSLWDIADWTMQP